MLRDIPYLIAMIFIAIFVISFTGYYYQNGYTQDTTVLSMNETLRASVISNVDNSSRISEGELYISVEDFEKDFKEKVVKNNNIKTQTEATFIFEYLYNENKSIKAIRVKVKQGDREYQATTKIDISES